MTIPPAILVGTVGKTVLVRVEGKGTFLNCTGLKEFAKEMINRGFRDFSVDLRNCPLMDSTFMGTLAMVALRLKELGQGELRAVELNERNHELLTNLGLDQLFTLRRHGEAAPGSPALQPIGGDSPPDAPGAAPTPVTPLPTGPVDKTAQAQTMLDAHIAVVEANPANAAKFKDVIEYLKHDLRGGL